MRWRQEATPWFLRYDAQMTPRFSGVPPHSLFPHQKPAPPPQYPRCEIDPSSSATLASLGLGSGQVALFVRVQ